MTAQLLVWESAALSHVGKIRTVNEDAYLNDPELGLWAIADGMGGHEGGEVASNLIIEHLQHVTPEEHLDGLIESVSTKLEASHRRLQELTVSRYQNRTIGSTIVVLVAFANRCACIWAGDSRVYRYRNGAFVQLTRDHSLFEDYLQHGWVSPEESETNPVANMLTRAVGVDELCLDTCIEEMRRGDTFLLCSDGLYKDLAEQEMAAIVADTNPGATVNALLELALSRSATDNISIVVVHIDEVFC